MHLFIFIHILFHISLIFSQFTFFSPVSSSFLFSNSSFFFFYTSHHSSFPFPHPVSLSLVFNFFFFAFFFALALHFSQSLSGIFYSSHYHHQTPPANHHPSHRRHCNTWQFFPTFQSIFPLPSATITALVTHYGKKKKKENSIIRENSITPAVQTTRFGA